METKETHTPGPWKVKKYPFPQVPFHNWFDHVVMHDARGGKIIARVLCMGEELSGEELSNAKLLAAAPDLLAACKDQHHAIDILFAMLIVRSPENKTFYPSKSGVPWAAVLKGNAAIKKAMGE